MADFHDFIPAVAGTVKVIKIFYCWIIEHYMASGTMMFLRKPLSSMAIKSMHMMARPNYYRLSILVKHAFSEVRVSWILFTSPPWTTILLLERYLLCSCKVLTWSLVYFNHHAPGFIVTIVWGDNPKLVFMVVHQCCTKCTDSLLIIFINLLILFKVCEIQKISLWCPWLVLFLNFVGNFVDWGKRLVWQVRASNVDLTINIDHWDVLVRRFYIGASIAVVFPVLITLSHFTSEEASIGRKHVVISIVADAYI